MMEEKYLLAPSPHIRIGRIRLPFQHIALFHFSPVTLALGVELLKYGIVFFVGCFAIAIANYPKFLRLEKIKEGEG